MEEIKEHSLIDYEKIHPRYLKSLDGVSDKIQAEVIELVTSIPFIYNLVRIDRKIAKDTPKDKSGKVIVNITEPHLLEDTDYFRERALFFQKHKKYTNIYPNNHPNSDWMKFWSEESRRCLEGHIRESDGEWITGEHYWYLNYCPILKATSQAGDTGENVYAVREEGFPEFWDGDYLYFHYRQQARAKGLHCNVLKTRRRGYSYKGATVLTLPYYHMRNQKSYAMASEGEFLYVDGLLNDKTWNMMSFIDNNTPWTQPRDYKDTEDHKRASYKDPDTKTERGRLNEIIGVTLKNNSQKARGKAGINILWEEYGVMPDGLTSWTIALGSMKQGRKVYGQMGSFGCLTAGNKVWDNEGSLVNIEDLDLNKGILGYKRGEGISTEPITYWQPPAEKECIKITTNSGRSIECSTDHPILWSRQNYGTSSRKIVKGKRKFIKKTKFVEAENIKIGDQLATIDIVDIFSTKEMWEPRLIGMLIGDGSYGFDKTPILSNCDEELNDFIYKKFNCKEEKSYITKDGRIYKETRIKDICPKLREVGIYGQTKNKKTLPLNIHSYSKNTITELLAGLFDTDGYYNKKGYITLTSSSKNLLLEVQLLMQKLGIHGLIHEIKITIKEGRKDRNNYFRLTISGKINIERFYKEIKPLIKYKREALQCLYDKAVLQQIIKSKEPSIKGLRFERVISIEKTGLKPIYNLTAGNTNTYIGNGIITHNTGGTAGSAFEAMETLFYKGDSYDVYMLPNVFDRAANGSNCAFYVGEYLNREFCYDKLGNSNPIKALVEIVKEWKTKDAISIVQFKADYSITPQDACLRKEGTIFPVTELKELLAEIMPNYRSFVGQHYIGDISIDAHGKTTWSNKESASPIHEFPVKDNKNKKGAIEIFVPPVSLNNNSIPYGRYIAGTDPYDDDSSTTNSLGSTFVLDTFTDEIVCEYTGRPPTADEYYTTVYKILKYYNATCLYEAFNKGLFGFMDKKRALYLLADNPKILKQMDYIKGDFSGNKSKGYPPSKPVNSWGRRLFADWLISSPLIRDEEKSDQCNLHKLRSIGLIKEAIGWNSDGNFDRISALQALMIYREERSKYNVSVIEEVDTDNFFFKNYKPTRDKLRQAYFNKDNK